LEDLQTLVLRVVVVDVQAMRGPAAEHRVPKQLECDVLGRGVPVSLR
jgi:hypothetical protein